jgi:hypothetical protein
MKNPAAVFRFSVGGISSFPLFFRWGSWGVEVSDPPGPFFKKEELKCPAIKITHSAF